MFLFHFFPARAPEWNPIELVWSCLEARLGTYKLKQIKQKRNRVVYTAADILKKITPKEVEAFYCWMQLPLARAKLQSHSCT